MDELLLLICKIAGTGFFVFLLGFAAYSIIRSDKKRQLKKQKKQEQLEAARFERYFSRIDDDLKKEIDNAERKAHSQCSDEIDAENHSSNSWTKGINDAHFDEIFSQLRANTHKMIEKGFKLMEKGEEKYKKYNAKYHFDDEFNSNLENQKQKVKDWTDKIMEYFDRL